MPIFVRAGAIFPVDPVRQYTEEKVDAPLTIRIYRGADGDYTLYEDDGVSAAYKQEGFRRTTVNAKRVGFGYVVTTSAPLGSYQPGNRKLNFVVKAVGRERVATTVDNGSAQTIKIN